MLKSARGFTLVELLVVISIVAILSVVGVAVFGSAQKSARDARRKADIDAIAKALEVNMSGTYPATVLGTWFAGGSILRDPRSTSPGDHSVTGCGNSSATDTFGDRCWYCFKSATFVTQANAGTGAAADYCTGSDDYLDNNISDNVRGKRRIICANLESGNPRYYCRSTQQ